MILFNVSLQIDWIFLGLGNVGCSFREKLNLMQMQTWVLGANYYHDLSTCMNIHAHHTTAQSLKQRKRKGKKIYIEVSFLLHSNQFYKEDYNNLKIWSIFTQESVRAGNLASKNMEPWHADFFEIKEIGKASEAVSFWSFPDLLSSSLSSLLK